MSEKLRNVVLVLLVVVGATAAASKTLPEDGTLGELAWKTLLRAGQSKAGHEPPLPSRRITTKSLFIAPQIGMESVPDCPDGHRVNTKGDCVKVITLDQNAHLEFLLQKLNSQYATEEVKEESYDYDIEEAPENSGPIQFNIPLPSGPKPEDTEGSVDAFVLTKKEIQNANDIPDKSQFFLVEIPAIPTESPMENVPQDEVTVRVENETTTAANGIEEVALVTELELLKLENNDTTRDFGQPEVVDSRIETATVAELIENKNNKTNTTDVENPITDIVNDANATPSKDNKPTNAILLDLLSSTEPDLKMDNKLKIMSGIADVKTAANADIREDKKSYVDSEVSESSSVNLNTNSIRSPDVVRPPIEIKKPILQNKILEYEALNRQPYWWLPPGWEVRPPKERNHLINFWSRLPLVTDASFDYPYVRRPQRHYLPYQHALYPQPQYPKPVASYDQPVFNYRTARHYRGNRERIQR